MTASDSTKTRRIVFLDRATLPQTVTVRKPGFAHSWQDHPRTAAGTRMDVPFSI